MPIVFSVGSQGGGKTIFNVATTFKANKGRYDPMLQSDNTGIKYSVLSNLGLRWLPDCNKRGGNLNPMELNQRVRENKEFSEYTSILIHEAHRWFDARLSMRMDKKYHAHRLEADYLIEESRKRKVILEVDAQHRKKLDNRIRDEARFTVFCFNYAADIDRDDPILEYIICRDLESISPSFWKCRPGKSWWKFYGSLYDTYEIPPHRTESDLYMNQEPKQLIENHKEAEESIEIEDASKQNLTDITEIQKRLKMEIITK